nr:ribonuclease H domain-containing protein [Tanacetum cinerariifolium]
MDIIDDDTLLLLSEQRRELTTAITADSDLDFAFHLQMQEAITASLTSSYSTTKPLLPLTDVTDSPSGIAHLLAAEIDNFNREYSDREFVKNEMSKMHENVNMLMHDQVFARQVMDVPDNEWRKTGDWIEKPYGKGVESSGGEEVFRVYCKGIVSDNDERFGGVGVAICDTRDCCVFEVRKAVTVNGEDVVEVKGVIEGLSIAVSLGLRRVRVFCDSDAVYGYLTGKGQPTNNTTVTLVDQLNVIQRKFAYCGAYLVRQHDLKFAYKLARDAITSQVTQFAENTSGETLLEQCTICFDAIYSGQMFSVNKCLHKYCFSCMRKHVEAKLLQGQLPECPHEGCKSHLELESCKKFLNLELYEILSLRIKEASIPTTEKVYCPFSNCSTLMSKGEVQEFTASSSAAPQGSGMRKCVKCGHLFCVNCKVPWHDNFTCSDYKMYYPNGSANEAKLKSLATKNSWRECIKCKNLVELAAGCYHIYCRCGYQFCYTCGAEMGNGFCDDDDDLVVEEMEAVYGFLYLEMKCEIEVEVCGDGGGEFTALLCQGEHRVVVDDVHGDDFSRNGFYGYQA